MGLNPLSDMAVEFVKSTVGKVVGQLADHYLPASMSEKDKEDFKLKAQELALQEIKVNAEAEKVYADDRKSAREREIAVRDRTPQVLAYFSFIGFFGILSAFMFIEIPPTAKDPLMIMLGILGAMVTGEINYYFGSSSGSAAKTATIDKMLKG